MQSPINHQKQLDLFVAWIEMIMNWICNGGEDIGGMDKEKQEP